MSYTFIISVLFCCVAIGKGTTSLKVSENNGSSVFVELLRGRDGLPGREGPSGKDGNEGLQGPPGPSGPVGDDGPPGPAGPPGLTGPTGYTGPAGLTGPTGLTGHAGPPGPTGLTGPAGPPGPNIGGAIYTRWGKSSCPQGQGTTLLYSGITAGAHYTQSGGGANYLCMPKVPEYSTALRYRSGVNGYAYIHGTEYEYPIQGTHHHNVPCAVCYVSTRPTVLMIPAKASCPTTWTREYYGYIMSSHHTHQRTMFECVDEDQESLPGQSQVTYGALFYHVEVRCNYGLPCPPYNSGKELNCVVCTK